MDLIKDSKTKRADIFVITGDGGTEYYILKGLCSKFRNSDKILLFPRKGILKQTGLDGLNSVQYIPKDYTIQDIIYTVDRDCFKTDIKNRRLNIKNKKEYEIIEEYLKTIGVRVNEITTIEKAYLMNCTFSNYEFNLYCVILGIDVCLEEEIMILLEKKYNIKINISGPKNRTWKLKVKTEIEKALRSIGKNKYEIIKDAGIKYIQEAFPNLYAILKEIE